MTTKFSEPLKSDGGDGDEHDAQQTNSSSGNDNCSSSKSLLPNCSSESELRLLDDVLSKIPLGHFHWRMLVLVGGGYFAVCSEMMLVIFLSSPLQKEWDLEDYAFPWLPFSTGITGIIGGYVAGKMSDKYGRRNPFLAGMLIIAVFGVVSAVAPSFPVFITFRCLVTAGIGTFEAVGFVLLLEFLPRQRRGSILVVVTLCGALGAVYTSGFKWLIMSRWGWRWLVGVCALPSIFVLLFQPFAFYETPRHLFTSGREDEGLEVIRQMTRINKCDLPRLDRVECPVDKSRGTLSKLFSKELRWQTLTFTCIWFLQASGYWGVTIYLPEYMDQLGVDSNLSIFSVFIGEIPGLLLAMLLIERQKFGRTGCLRVYAALTAVSLLMFSFIPKHILKSVLIVICYFSMVPIYSILNAFTPEVYPTDVRCTAMAWMNFVIEIPGLITPFIGVTLLSSDIPWLYPVVWASVFAVQFCVTFGIRFDSVMKNLRESTTQNTLEVCVNEGNDDDIVII